MTRRRVWLAAAAVAALAVVAVLVTVSGGRAVLHALAAADPVLAAATLGLAVCWLVAWGLMLRATLGALGVDLSPVSAFFLYAAAVFANDVTPFGQAGGEPVAAALVAGVTGARYETSLVGVATVDVCNVFPSLLLVLVGVGVYATRATVSRDLAASVGAALVLVGGIAVALAVAWRARERIVDSLPALVGRAAARFTRGRLDADHVATGVAGRLERAVRDVGTVAGDRRRLALVLSLSLVGWLCQVAALVVAFAALGASVPPVVALFVVPLANVAGAAPLPGGLGSIEAAFVALLLPLTGTPAATVTAAVLAFRGAVYWFPVLLGGATTAVVGSRTGV